MDVADIASGALPEGVHRSQLRRAIIASTVGTTIEWYDFLLYGIVTGLVFGKLFFPKSDPLVGVLEAFSIYAVGFIARPFGAAIFGHFGDRVGRKAVLITTRRIIADILALATLPARAEIAAERFRQAQLRTALETLRLGFDTRRACYRAVAADELAASLAQAASAAESAARLAKELGETGAMNKLDRAREQAFAVELSAQLAASRQRAASERERLIRVLGLEDGGALQLPHILPPLPKALHALVVVETEAIRRRVDLRIARMEVDTLAKTYGLTNATRFINLLEVAGISRTRGKIIMSQPSPLSRALKIADKVIGRAGGGRDQKLPESSRVGRRVDHRRAPGDHGPWRIRGRSTC
jgi:hypothetical protein